MGKIRKFGLIGKPLTHTFSPKYFAKKFELEGIRNSEYKAYELEDISEIENLFSQDIEGLNVTIPYKEKVIPYLHGLDESAALIQAVNTIKRNGNKYVGYNTDVIGFQESIGPSVKDLAIKNCLILGSGGASKAVKFAMEKLGYNSKVVSRSEGNLLYADIDEEQIQNCSVIVNTTPLGMYPKLDTSPDIPYHYISSNHLVYDLVYNPEKTLFLEQAERQGAKIMNGREMLRLQAEASWKIWNY